MTPHTTVEPRRPLASVEGKQLEARLLAASADEVVTYEDLSAAAGGFDYRGRSQHHTMLQKVISRLRDERHVLFACERGVGYRRLADEAAVAKAGERLPKIAQQAELGRRETICADRAALPDGARRVYDAQIHLYNVHSLFSKPETVLRTAQVATNKPLPMKMDDEFLRSMT